MSLLAVNCDRRSYSTLTETQPMRSDRIGRQIDDPENSPCSSITDEVNARAIPMIVEVPSLKGD